MDAANNGKVTGTTPPTGFRGSAEPPTDSTRFLVGSMSHPTRG
jgi:hypothetical protein